MSCTNGQINANHLIFIYFITIYCCFMIVILWLEYVVMSWCLNIQNLFTCRSEHSKCHSMEKTLTRTTRTDKHHQNRNTSFI